MPAELFSPSVWQQIKTAFDEAAGLPPGEREAVLDALDPAVKQEVVALLTIHDEAGDFLETPEARPLEAGHRLGPYEIVDRLGGGGMGDVYRAHDARLTRDVAIKVVRGRIGERARARFRREAQAIAALSHSNVLAVFDVGEDNRTPYLVTELLEGETLRARLRRGPIAIAAAVRFTIQIANGLAAAHDCGIVHRDLKPENIFLVDGDHVKILDFGLARAPARGRNGSSDSGDEALSSPGMIVGTAGYLAPEQARGAEVTAASDLFSVGAMLYEMLTGERAFRGDDVVATMRAVLEHEPPPPSSLRPEVPPLLDQIVARCLAKAVPDRFESARDLAFVLAASPPAAAPTRRRWWPYPVIAGAALASTAAIVATRPGESAPPRDPVRTFPVTHSGRDRHPAVSPDGRFLAFTSDRDGRPRIWLQQLELGRETPLTAGTDSAPRFSPDGNQILFTRVEPQGTALYRVGLIGGEVHKVAGDASDGDWSPDGRQVAFVRPRRDGSGTMLMITDVGGGGERELALLGDRPQRGRGSEQRVRWSPDGRRIAVTGFVHHPGAPQYVKLIPLDGSAPTTVAAPNRIGLLSAVAWDGPDAVIYSQSLSVSGNSAGSPARIVRQQLRDGTYETLAWTPESSFVVDRWAGRGLVFDARSSRTALREVTLATGSSRVLSQGTSTDRQPCLSPDGQRVVFSSNRGGDLNVWAVDRNTGAVQRLTDHPGDDWDPSLTTDGALIWSSDRSGNFEIWTADRDGANPRQITRDGVDAENPTLSADRNWLIYASGAPDRAGVWKVRLDGSEATKLVADAVLPELSPDGRHVVFQTNRDPRHVVIGVVAVADGARLPFEIRVEIRRPGLPLLGRPHWTPDGQSIAFIGQDETGATGVFTQAFAPDGATSATRKPVAGFDPERRTESFDIAGDHVILAESDSRADVMAATFDLD